MPDVPAADDVDFELSQHGAQAGGECEAHRAFSGGAKENVAAPLQRERAHAWCARCRAIITSRTNVAVDEPHSPRVSGPGSDADVPLSRSDQQVGGVVKSADRAVAVEQRLDLAFEQGRSTTVRAHRPADEVERDGVGVEVERLTDLTDSVHLCRPAPQVVDPYEASVEIGD